MSSENNDSSIRNKKQQEIEAKENEIEQAINSVSDKEVKESKKEANAIGDDHE